WDFTFSFTAIPPNQLAGMRGAPSAALPAETAVAASDPVGGTSVFDAVEKQLGVKLEAQKRPYPVFVIDHIEEKPTDNLSAAGRSNYGSSILGDKPGSLFVDCGIRPICRDAACL